MKINEIIKKISKVIDVIICVLLVVITISKGGFYKEDIIFPVLVISGIGLLYAIIKVILNIKENGVIKKSKLVTSIDFFMILLPIAYFLPVVFKKYLSLENAMFEAIRYTNMSIVYFIVRSSKNKNMYVNILLGIACLVGVLGIDEITFRVMEDMGLPIGYLDRNFSIISSVVQYANIAAILMIVGISIAMYYELSTKKLLYQLINIFLQCLVILTSSRMGAVLLILTNVIYFVHCMKQKENAYGILINLFIAIVTAGLISNLIENGKYIWVYVTLVLVFALVWLLKLVIPKVSVITQKRFNKVKINKKVKIYVGIFVVTVILLFFSIPSDLKVTAEKAQTRKTTEFVTGQNELYLKVKKSTDDTSFVIYVNLIYEDYKPEQVLEIKDTEFVNNEIKLNFKVSPNIQFVEFVYEVANGQITIEETKINNEDITVSYAFLPDRLTFRFKEADIFDLNNKLRVEYYLDSLKLISNSVLIGNGGEGFKLGYQMVQESNYISSEAHSSPLQITVEAGVIGGVSYIAINILAIIILVVMLKSDKGNNRLIALLTMIIAINVMSALDLTMSFAIMTYVLAVVIGLIVNNYIETPIDKDSFMLDNKSGKSMIKLGVISFVILVLVVINIYILNVYRASLIILPNTDNKETIEYEDTLFAKIVLLEEKLELDKYNINYMIELNNTYYDYIEILKNRAISSEDNETAQSELAKYILKQKTNVDNMVECEYYNKYAIEQVASCYFTNYIRYSDILEKNFENTEVAYAFYLNYALKLSQRLMEIGEHNKVANNMYKNILEVYLENLKNQNKYIQSLSVQNVINEMQRLVAKTQEL